MINASFVHALASGLNGTGWIAVLIGSIAAIAACVFLAASGSDAGAFLAAPVGVFALGAAVFAAYKVFCGLTVSALWIFLAWLILIVDFFIPGGYTITNWLIQHNELADVSWWLWAAGAVIDLLTLLLTVCIIIAIAHPSKNDTMSL